MNAKSQSALPSMALSIIIPLNNENFKLLGTFALNDLREVTLGDKGLFKTAKKGSIYIDNTTASANIARELYNEAKTKGFDFLDAPISGGQAGAEGGTLTVMVGGESKL